MLETIIIVLLVLWLIGMVTANTFGGALHLILAIAAVIIVLRLIGNRRTT